MSFFVTEHFNLPNGAVQDSIETETSGNGTVYTSDGWGVVATYADADGALIVPDEGLTVSEFATTPFRVSLKYKLSALTDGDTLILFCLTSMATAPEVDDFGFGYQPLRIYLVRSGAAYYERWIYTDDSADYYWDGAAWGGADNVRAISLDTEYTLTITYDPGTRSFDLDNGTDTATTGRVAHFSDDYWYYGGDQSTSNHYGILKYDYIIIEDIEVSNTLISHNNLLTETYHSNHFNGANFWLLNDFRSEVSNDLIIKNDILDYDPVENDLVILNRIGKSESQIYTPSVKVLLNDVDVTPQMLSYSIDWGERFVKNLTIDFDQSVSASIYKKNNENFQTPQIEILVDYDSSGTYVTRGEFFIEEISETISNGKYARRISGRSKGALLDIPYSAPDTISYESTTKRTIVTGLIEAAGLECEWNLPDGPIEYHTFEAKTPASIINEIVAAIGGRISVDYNDKIYFYANDFEPANQSPALSVTSSDVHQVQIVESFPQSVNKITVKGRSNDEATFRAWAEIELVSVDSRGNLKSTLAADGNDYAVLVATCYDSEGALVDTELIEEESATPSDSNTISVSKRITNDGVVGVWPDSGGGVPGTVIAGPYTFDGSTITTTGNMLDGAHLVTYYGGDTVSFSVDGPGVVEETSVLIEDGQGRGKLYGNELDAGTITVIATYDGQESNPVALILGDPRVGDIDANANPSSLQTSETSEITAMVYDPDGDAVGDGYEVKFDILAGNGTLSSPTASTTTNTIENEEQVSSSYTSISVENTISALTSIYVLKGDSEEYEGITIGDDEIDESFDYATGATTDGSTINLSYQLPKPQTRVVVTYTSGGTAQVIYTAPSSVPSDGSEVIIEAWAGGLNHLVFINVGRRTGTTPSAGGGHLVNSVIFNVDYTPTSADRGTFKLSEPIPRVVGYDVRLGSYVVNSLSRQLTGGEIIRIKRIGYNIVVEIRAEKKDSISDYYAGGAGRVTGSRKVFIKNTDIPVKNAAVVIEWDGGTASGGWDETVTTTSLGVFTFTEGVSGTHNLTITHDGAQNPDAPLGLQEYSGTIYVAGRIGTDGVKAIDTQTFYETVKGTFSIPVVYSK